MIKYFIAIWFLFQLMLLKAQNTDTTLYTKTFFGRLKSPYFQLIATKTDTDFCTIHNYMPFYTNFLAHLGNGTSATYSFIPIFITDLPFWLQPFQIYYNEIQDLYFHTHTPFTHIKLTANNNRTYNEEGLKLIHTQNIKPNWNIAFIGKSNKQIGRIQRQDHRLHYFFGSTQYQSSRYQLYANYYFSKIKIKENGGVSNLPFLIDSLFPIENALVYLSNATNNYTYQKGNAQQAICLSFQDDSLSEKWKPFIIHHFEYTKAKKIYADVLDTTFYFANRFIDSSKTYDSLYFRNIENQIGIAISNNLKTGSGISIYALSSNQKTYSHQHPKNIDNMGTGMLLFYNNASFSAQLNFKYWINGYLKGNKHVQISTQKNIHIAQNDANWIFDVAYHQQAVDYFATSLYTNHFQWQQSLPTTTEISTQTGIENESNGIYLNLKNIKNAVYFDTQSHPQTINNNFMYASMILRKTFHAGRFHLSNHFMMQYITDTLISVPFYAGYHILYYENQLFKKVLGIQLGSEVFYHSIYQAVSYNPALGNFFNNNTSKLGNYPYINIFANLKLKRARFFVKIEHLNYHWQKANYSMVYAYPMPPRSLKFGILWSFYD
ncbi:MAG: hypothetical protein HPY79_09590 [Bacteroidales bacterium]|nr:hypothetical protein [Bacteroidales bacterium]